MKSKPKVGESCNGCGLCCLNQVCKNGAYVLGLVDHLGDNPEGPCPAVVKHPDGTYTCGIVQNPNKYIKNKSYPAAVKSRNFAFLIGAGAGCDELLENDTVEEEEKLNALINEKLNDTAWHQKAERAMNVIHND